MFDINNPDHLLELKNEIMLDPLVLGYDSTADLTNDILNPINLKRVEFVVSKPKISSALVRATVTLSAYDNILADKQEWLRWMTGTNGFDEENMVVTQDLRDRLTGELGGSLTGASIWAAADDQDMEPLMLALIDVPGSRAEILWGYGTVITRTHWTAARDA